MQQWVVLNKLMAIFLLAVAANLDNFGIGLAFGTASLHISALANVFIALIAGVLSYAATLCGNVLEILLPLQVANWVGAWMIVGVGVWVTNHQRVSRWFQAVQTWLKYCSGQHGPRPTLRSPQKMDLKTTVLLGISLSLNAMAGGLGAGLSGYSPVWTALAIALVSYLTLDMGQGIGSIYLGKYLGPSAQKVAGLLLIGVGVYELFN